MSGRKGEFGFDKSVSDEQLLELLSLVRGEGQRFFESTVEEDKAGVDVWMVDTDGRVVGIDAKILLPVRGNDIWHREIPVEVWSHTERDGTPVVGWAFDESKVTDLYLFAFWEEGISVWTAEDYKTMIWAAVGGGFYHKEVNNPNGGKVWYIRDTVAEALRGTYKRGVYEHGPEYRRNVPAHLRGPRGATEAMTTLLMAKQKKRDKSVVKPTPRQLMEERREY